jgi:hypothetical protein
LPLVSVGFDLAKSATRKAGKPSAIVAIAAAIFYPKANFLGKFQIFF